MRKVLIGLATLFALALTNISATAALAQARGGHGGRERGGYGHGGFGGGYPAGGFRGGGFRGGGYAPPPEFRGGGGFGPRGYPGPRAAYGPPPGLGARGFTRGQFLPPGYEGGAVVDPRQYHLRRAPNGYGWVTVGPNAYLTQRSTGLILDTAPLY